MTSFQLCSVSVSIYIYIMNISDGTFYHIGVHRAVGLSERFSSFLLSVRSCSQTQRFCQGAGLQ